MTNYYLMENGIVTQSADWKFDDNCLATQEEIVREELSGVLYLKSDYEKHIQTEEHSKLKKERSNFEIKTQIADIEKSQARALREMVINPNDTAKQKLQEIENQIQELRSKL